MPIVYLALSASNLPKLDTFSASDPFVRVLIGDKVCGMTEVIMDAVNPKWIRRIAIPFRYGAGTTIKFEVYDFDAGEAADVAKQDLIGVAAATPEKLLAAKGATTLLLDSEHSLTASLTLQPIARPAGADRSGTARLTFTDLQTSGLTIAHRYVISISRTMGGNDINVARSGLLRRGGSTFFELALDELCDGSENRAFRIVLSRATAMDGETELGHDYMTLAMLEQVVASDGATITFGRGHKAPTVKMSARISGAPLFTDFAPSCTVQIAAAIDLSAATDAEYQGALEMGLRAAAAIDSDGRIPLFGFGAEHGAGKCFPLVEIAPEGEAQPAAPAGPSVGLETAEYSSLDAALTAITETRDATPGKGGLMLSIALQRAIMAATGLAKDEHLFFLYFLQSTPVDMAAAAAAAKALPDNLSIIVVFSSEVDPEPLAAPGLILVAADALTGATPEEAAETLLSAATARAAASWAAAGVVPNVDITEPPSRSAPTMLK